MFDFLPVSQFDFFLSDSSLFWFLLFPSLIVFKFDVPLDYYWLISFLGRLFSLRILLFFRFNFIRFLFILLV